MTRTRSFIPTVVLVHTSDFFTNTIVTDDAKYHHNIQNEKQKAMAKTMLIVETVKKNIMMQTTHVWGEIHRYV